MTRTVPPEELQRIKDEAKRYADEKYTPKISEFAQVHFVEGATSEYLRDKWIPTSERLPEINQECLIAIWGRTQKATYKGKWPTGPNSGSDAWLCDDLDHWPGEDVTHWQPLPSPPYIEQTEKLKE